MKHYGLISDSSPHWKQICLEQLNDPGPHHEENQSNHSKGLLLLELVGKRPGKE